MAVISAQFLKAIMNKFRTMGGWGGVLSHHSQIINSVSCIWDALATNCRAFSKGYGKAMRHKKISFILSCLSI